MKNLLLIASIGLLLSCTKLGKNVTVKGRVLNPITNEPTEGITVFLYKNNFKTIDKMITGTDGKFEVNAGNLSELRVGVNTNNYKGYYKLGWDYKGKYYQAVKVKKGKKMNIDYHLVPYGKCIINITNVNCQDVTDTAYYKFIYSLNPYAYDYWSLPLVGCQPFTSSVTQKLPMGEYVLAMKIKRGGEVSYQYDTLFVEESEVPTFNIEY